MEEEEERNTFLPLTSKFMRALAVKLSELNKNLLCLLLLYILIVTHTRSFNLMKFFK